MIRNLEIKKCVLILTILLLSIVFSQSVRAETNTQNLVNIYFFHSTDCAYCKSEIELLDSLEKKYENINIYRYEIHDKQNNEIRKSIEELYNIKNSGVPLTIIGDTTYMGYNSNTSNIKFIKTIEYYSKYGYEDKVGNLLGIDTLPTYEPSKNNPRLEEFMETYGNYKLIGPIFTDDLDYATNSIVLGIISQINIIKIITMIIIILILFNLNDIKKETYLFAIYLIMSLLLNTTNITFNSVYKTIILISILILFVLMIILYLKKKKIQYIYISIIIIIGILTNYLEINYLNYIEAFKKIMNLHNLTGLSKLGYYENYLFIVLAINILLILTYQYTKIKLKKILK